MLSPQKGHSPLWRIAWWGAWIVPLLLFWDFARFFNRYQHYHQSSAAGIDQLTLPPIDGEVLVVLTGDMGRIPRALELLRSRNSTKLIISGTASGVSLSDIVNQQGATTENLPLIWERIVLESESTSTIENALFTRAKLASELPRRLILITSDYHMDRSLAIFQQVFPDVEIVPFSVSSVWTTKHSWHFIWKTGAEYWKSLAYRLSFR